eukprot:14944268-Alexandrium_andersonii.AAC.1
MDIFEISIACGVLGTPDDSTALRGVLARVLGQETFPDPAMLAGTSEEDFKRAISDLGFYVDRSGGHEEFAQIGLMDKGRLLEFRAR